MKIKINQQYVKMEIDSGAEVNILNETTYHAMIGGEINTQNQKQRAPTLGGVHKTYRNVF